MAFNAGGLRGNEDLSGEMIVLDPNHEVSLRNKVAEYKERIMNPPPALGERGYVMTDAHLKAIAGQHLLDHHTLEMLEFQRFVMEETSPYEQGIIHDYDIKIAAVTGKPTLTAAAFMVTRNNATGNFQNNEKGTGS